MEKEEAVHIWLSTRKIHPDKKFVPCVIVLKIGHLTILAMPQKDNVCFLVQVAFFDTLE